jgi:penicillin amidase
MKRISLVFLVVFLAVFGAYAQEKTLTVAGLKEPVTVRRDARAIPYLEAKNEADLYFAQGYVTASDRLFQMDLMRRVARGETAEIFGTQGLEEDKRWRKLGFSGITAESYKILAPELKASLDNYARGVNAYIATLKPETLPGEYKILQFTPREWVPTDSLVIGKILSDALSNTWRMDLQRVAIEQLPEAKAAALENQVTNEDVVWYGNDHDTSLITDPIITDEMFRRAPTVRKKSKGTSSRLRNNAAPSKVSVSSELLDKAQQLEDIRRSSLEKTGLYAEDNAASNNWVISGKRTADGKAIMANDPHLQATAPGIWYLVNQSMPGMRVSGVTLPGVPGVILGHNESIAWGATNLGPDVQDLYIENAETLKAAKLRKEEIKVRKNPLGKVTDQNIETLNVLETKNGVVYFEDGDKKFSLKWTARDPKNMELGAFYYLNRAKDWAGFNKALMTYGGASQNFVYADVKGNIGWHTAGTVPTRRVGDGSLPYDGAKTDGDWTGVIPYAEMPNLYNPPGGFIVTANQRVTGTENKYFSILSRDSATPWRARRITDMILQLVNNGKLVTMDNVGDIQKDVTNLPVMEFVNEVIELEGAMPETLAALKNWDGRMTFDAKTSLLANEMRVVFAEKLAEANLLDKDGKRLNISTSMVRERAALRVLETRDKEWLPRGFASYKDLLLECERQAQLNLGALAARLKKERSALVWGDYYTANFFHPLGGIPLIGGAYKVQSTEVNGSGQTPNVGASVSMRHIASPGNWDATRHVIPLGESGDPNSPHWKDQFEAWRTGKTPVFPFSKEAVEKAATDVTVMTPGK